MTATDDIARVPGVSETTLDPTTRADLPATAPPAPWRCRCDALLWVARPTREARRALAPAVAGRGRPVAVIGGFVRYSHTPVGRYDEALAAVVSATRSGLRASIPFMAVDLPASLLGGRANWSLPKTLARFTGSLDDAPEMLARTPTWSIRASARAMPAGLRVAAAGRLLQEWPDGLLRGARMHSRGHARPALVRVDVNSDGRLPRWVRPGRHPGAVLHDVKFTLEPAHAPRKEAR